MKKFLVLSTFIAFTSISQASFEPIPDSQRYDAIKRVQTSIMKKFENGRPDNCMMPDDHGFGVLFKGEDGGLRSRDFFFTSNDGELLNLAAYYDDGLNAIMLEQSTFSSDYSLVVTFSGSVAKDINLSFVQGGKRITVRCDK